jgi:hypothetical protein
MFPDTFWYGHFALFWYVELKPIICPHSTPKFLLALPSSAILDSESLETHYHIYSLTALGAFRSPPLSFSLSHSSLIRFGGTYTKILLSYQSHLCVLAENEVENKCNKRNQH